MVEILHYTSGLADVKAGVETYILNMNEFMDKNEYKFTLLTRNAKKDTQIYNLIMRSGIEIIDLECSSLNLSSMISFHQKVKTFFENNRNRFSFLHFHGCDDPFIIEEARRNGIPFVGLHAHSVTRENENKILRIIKNFTASRNIRHSDYLFASCKEAGEARFGRREFVVLHNTVNSHKFKYSEQKRLEKRDELGLQDQFTICFVGRLVPIKNIPFLIDIVSYLEKWIPDVKLLVVGDGEEKEMIQEYAYEKINNNSVIFLGNRSDVDELLCASDVYVQTSFSEGFSIAVLEAQCSGIPMFLSTGFPKEVELTDLVNKIELSQGAEEWAKKIAGQRGKENHDHRSCYSERIIQLKYDSKSNTEEMCRLYRGEK